MHHNPVCLERDGVLVAAGVLMLVHVLVSAVVFFMKKDRLVFIPNFGNGFNTTWLISLVVCIIVAALIWTRVGNEDYYDNNEQAGISMSVQALLSQLEKNGVPVDKIKQTIEQDIAAGIPLPHASGMNAGMNAGMGGMGGMGM